MTFGQLNIRASRKGRWQGWFGAIVRDGSAEDPCSIGHPIDPQEYCMKSVGQSDGSIRFIASDVPQFGSGQSVP